jgi:serine/threonine-protein kinase HipA
MSWEVHIEWQGRTWLVGRLHAAERAPTVSFEYAVDWLHRPGAFPIDPAVLPLRPGAQPSAVLFGAIQDCGPDRWGRMLIERAVRKKVLSQKPYRAIDYVLALDDSSRLGALRFREHAASPFLAASTGKLPPLIRLQALLRAADAIHSETDTAADLRFLLGAGSPLGGARPKSAIALPDGRLALAKFPKPDDTRDIAAGEILALSLAAAAGIRVVEHRLVSVGRHSAAVITRFDRAGQARIPFISGASLLGLTQGDPGAYTLLADGIRQFGHDVPGDLRELWRRLVFSLLASNYDDHLRNHGFLMLEAGRWALSPAYDLNPVPEIDRARVSKTPIGEDLAEPSLDGALAVAARFGLKPAEAKTILHEVFTAVSAWRQAGRKLRLKAGTLDAYDSAFEHELMDEARRVLGAG